MILQPVAIATGIIREARLRLWSGKIKTLIPDLCPQQWDIAKKLLAA
ncbi:MAG: hypothetical protein N2C12_05275 [Planctomycetales bacterium]